MNYLSDSWCNLTWSEWLPLENKYNELSVLPKSPGLYRIRPIGLDILVYIGQTGRSLKGRMGELRVYTKSEYEMPFNDPHTAAPSLWAWRDAEGWEFECSVAPAESLKNINIETRQMREGYESFLLWQYRLEKGESTLCNFGRFHPDYFKSSNKKQGRRGGKLPEKEINESSGPSLPPLKLKGQPSDNDWMGLQWNEQIPLISGCGKSYGKNPGLYKIILNKEVIYIGQSLSLDSRLNSHINKNWGDETEVSVSVTNKNIRSYQLHEWENDLIAGFFSAYQKPPKYQYRNFR